MGDGCIFFAQKGQGAYILPLLAPRSVRTIFTFTFTQILS